MNTSRRLKLINIALICILPLFAACEEKEEQFCNFIDLATSLCLNKVIEGAITGTLPTTGGSGTSNQTGINVELFDEYEPNNTLNNDNPLYFPSTDGSTREGIKVLGVVRDLDDVSDFFVFTPTRTGDYSISIRTGNCSCTATANGVYLMVYDQSQTTIASTPIATEAWLGLETRLNAGVAYYVEVNGADTYGVHFGYDLLIHESE